MSGIGAYRQHMPDRGQALPGRTTPLPLHDRHTVLGRPLTALQRRGIPGEFLYFPDENHWVVKPANSILWHDTVLNWMKRWTAAE